MAEAYVPVQGRSLVAWPAIFAGTFVFLAIEVTFGILGTAIFSPSGKWSGGAGVWLIVLSIIAMYFGALAAGHLGAANSTRNGVYHGLATFGVSIFAAIVIAALMTTFSGSGAAAARQQPPMTIIDAINTTGWWLFGALGGAFIACLVGGANSVPRALAPVSQVPTQRAA